MTWLSFSFSFLFSSSSTSLLSLSPASSPFRSLVRCLCSSHRRPLARHTLSPSISPLLSLSPSPLALHPPPAVPILSLLCLCPLPLSLPLPLSSSFNVRFGLKKCASTALQFAGLGEGAKGGGKGGINVGAFWGQSSSLLFFVITYSRRHDGARAFIQCMSVSSCRAVRTFFFFNLPHLVTFSQWKFLLLLTICFESRQNLRTSSKVSN